MSIWTELLQVSSRRAAGTRILEAGHGETLILLHGQGGHAENFRHNIAAYAQHFRVMAIDMPWHGLSSKHGAPSELIPELVSGVLALLDAENISSCYFEGQSLGGWVATRIAIDHPERVKGLVLTTPMGVGPAQECDAGVLTEWKNAQLRALDDVSFDSIKKRMSSLFADENALDDEVVSIRAAIYKDPTTNAALKAVATAYFNPDQVARYHVTEAELATLPMPTLIYWGTQNDPFPPSIGKALAAIIPNARYHCAEAGHWAQYEQPQEHNQVVLEFLCSL